MKATFTTLLTGALLLGLASCAKEIHQADDNQGQEPAPIVTLTARIADETKATLDESTGAFAFTAGDAIKVCNDKGTYASTGSTVTDGIATFTMADGFEDIGTGLAAFPAAIVTGMTKTTVTFTLPTTYTYAEVGGADASASKVPCPMISAYTSQSELYFKQAGSVVRFRLTNCVAGSITFTFTTKVTGTVTLTGVPDGADGGYHASDFAAAGSGYSITVTDVPEVTSPSYIYITLPVPTGTDPMNVGIWNNGSAMNKVATLHGTAASLNRAQGRKRGASLADVKETATFNGLSLAGDLYFYYEGSTKVYCIMEDPIEVLKYYKVDYTTSNSADKDIYKYYFNWDFLNEAKFKFTIDGKDYRVPSSGDSGDWAKIADTTSTNKRHGSIIKGIAAKYAYVTVDGLNETLYHRTSIGGVLLFPDDAIIAVDSNAKLNIFNTNDKADNNSISVSELTKLRHQGCSFFPTAGYWNQSEWYTLFWTQGWYGVNEAGSYWSDSAFNSSHAYALTILRNHTKNSPKNLLDPKAHDQTSKIYYPVRLIRVPSS